MKKHDIPISRVNDKKREADRMRAQWRIGLSTGRATLSQLLHAACHPDGSPLLRLRLTDVLLASGLSPAGVRKAMAHLRGGAGVKAEVRDRDLTVHWLLDPRAAPGRRMAAVADAICMARGSRLALVEPTGWPYRAGEGSR